MQPVTKPLYFDQVFIESYQVYKGAFKPTLFCVSLFAILTVLPQFWLHDMPWMGNLVYHLGLTLIGVAFVIYIIHQIYFISCGTALPPNVSFDTVKQKYWRALLLTIMVALPIAAGFILLILPGVFLYVLLFFAMPLFVIDNLSPADAFSQSASLAWGNWWRCFAILIVANVIPILLLYITKHDGTPFGLFIRGIILIILLVFYLPWFYSVMIVMFKDVKIRHANRVRIN